MEIMCVSIVLILMMMAIVLVELKFEFIGKLFDKWMDL